MRKVLVVVLLLLVACAPKAPVTPVSTMMPGSSASTAVAAAHAMTSTASILRVYKIPEGYYDSPCLKPAHLTFYDWMATLQMPPYEEYAFDCSQGAAYVEWLSENCSHRATIVGKCFEGYAHIWTSIELGGVPFAYEAGEDNRWVARGGEGSTHFHYDPDTEWESIYEAPWAHSSFEEEFAWWLTYPELWRTE